MERRPSFPDMLAGGIFFLIGGAFAVGSLAYDRGTSLRMGPAYFPLLAGVVVALFGVAIIVKGLVAGSDPEFGRIPWRAAGAIVLAIVFFGVFIRRLGFVPTSMVAAFLTTMASTRVRLRTALAVAAGLTVAATLIFVVGLQLRIPLWGS